MLGRQRFFSEITVILGLGFFSELLPSLLGVLLLSLPSFARKLFISSVQDDSSFISTPQGMIQCLRSMGSDLFLCGESDPPLSLDQRACSIQCMSHCIPGIVSFAVIYDEPLN